MTGPTRATDDDRTLLRDYARSRDEHAFATIVARYGPMVAATARRQTRDAAQADDVAQAAFLILARRAASIDGSLGAWLHRATLLSARNANRADARRRRHEREAIVQRARESTTPAENDPELLAALDAALDALPTRDREVIGLRFFESLGVAEIATRLGLNTETAKKRLSRATDRLRQALRGRDAASVGAAMAALAVPTDQAFTLAPTPAAQVIAKGTIGMMKQAMLAKAAILTTAAMATLGGVATIVAQQPTPPPIAAIVAPTPRPATRPVTFALPNGVGFELLAVSSSDHPGQWWTPDGSPTTPPAVLGLPADNANNARTGGLTSWFVARATTAEPQPFDGTSAREVPYAARGDGSWTANTEARSELHTAESAGARSTRDHFYLFERTGGPKDVATDVEFGFVTAPWQTIATFDPRGNFIQQGATDAGHDLLRTAVARIDDHATFTVFQLGKPRRWLQLVAFDGAGHPHFNHTNTTTIRSIAADDFQFTAALFDDLAPDQITRFEVQEKTFDKVRVVDVALVPGAETRPAAQDPTLEAQGYANSAIARLAFDRVPLEDALAQIAAAGKVRVDPPNWEALRNMPRQPLAQRQPVTLTLTKVTPLTAVRAACESAGVVNFSVVASPDGNVVRIVRGAYQPTYGNYGSLPPPDNRE